MSGSCDWIFAMKFHDLPAITFDDVLLVPHHTSMSRMDPALETNLTKLIKIKTPIISANMDTVTESKMAIAMHRLGGTGIIHRFMHLSTMLEEIKKCEGSNVYPICVAMGVTGSWKEDLAEIAKTKVNVICLDIAHGDSSKLLQVLAYIKTYYSKIQVICGNVATADGTKRLIECGADAVKVGIGPGSLCTTRLVTGCGVPQLSAIIDCVEVAKQYNVPVIADGGIRYSGDIVKSLAAGASSVMLGGLLAGTEESPGEIQRIKGEKYKSYHGMASKDAMIGWKGQVPEGIAAEGESTMMRYKGCVSEIVQELVGGIRSGMTYNDAKDIPTLYKNAIFRIISPNAKIENAPHGLSN